MGLEVGQLRACCIANSPVRYVEVTIRRASSRKDDTEEDSLRFQKEVTHSNREKKRPYARGGHVGT